MLYRLSKHYIKFVGEDNYEEGEIKSSTFFKTLDNDFYSTSLALVKEVIIESLLKKGYADKDIDISLNSCEELGRIEINFISTKEKTYSPANKKHFELFKEGKIKLYNITLCFNVYTSIDCGKTYNQLFLEE